MSTIVKTTIADTKFRRETSNFKIVNKYNEDTSSGDWVSNVYIPDPNSEDPSQVIEGLLQILPKNLGGEDFIGMIVVTGYANVEQIFKVSVDSGAWRRILLEADSWTAYYWPETGYLTDGVYNPSVTDETGDETGDGK